MTSFRVDGFAGTFPRIKNARLLGERQAQIATNTKLEHGWLEPYREAALTSAPTVAGALKTLYPLFDAGGNALWLTWAADVDAVLGPIPNDTTQRLYYTGDGEPRETNFSLATTGGTAFPIASRVLGVVTPTVAPTVGHTGGVASNITRVYRYTVVNADGEEGAASPTGSHTAPSDATSWNLSNMQTTPPNTFVVSAASWSAGVATVTVPATFGLRVGERAKVGAVNPTGYNTSDSAITALTATTISYAVASNPGAYVSGGQVDRIAPHKTTTWKQRIYRTLSGVFKLVVEQNAAATYNDSIADTALTDELPVASQFGDMPPVDLAGLMFHPSGFAVAFRGKEVWFSEPFKPWIWQSRYKVTCAFTVVAIDLFGSTIVAGTTKDPYTITGTLPESMTPRQWDKNSYPCLSKRSMRSTLGAVFWATHEGLVVAGPGGINLLTIDMETPDTWKLRYPSTMIGAIHRGNYFCAFTTPDGGAMCAIPLSEPARGIVDFSQIVDGFYADPVSGDLFFLDANRIYRWDDTSSPPLILQWRSGERVFPKPWNPGAARVECEFTQTPDEIAANQAAYDAAVALNKIILGQLSTDITGTTTNASAVVTGMTSTTNVRRGMSVTAASGIPANTFVHSVDAAMQVTLNQAATATGARTLTFTGSPSLANGAFGRYPFTRNRYAGGQIEPAPDITFDSCTFNVYGNGKLRFSKTVRDRKSFSMASGYKDDVFAIELITNLKVKGAQMAVNHKALERT